MSATIEWAPEFEAWVERLLEQSGTPGAAVVLYQHGACIYAAGIGLRDAEARLPVTPDTIFGTGSVTKGFTALAIMQLAEAGRLAVHDPVVNYLPELRLPSAEATERVTLHHLLTHTAGLPPMPGRHYAALAEMVLDDDERREIDRFLAGLPPRGPIRSFVEMIAFLGEHRYSLHGAPGERFSYSNESYTLLGQIVERVSGEEFATYLGKHILAPLGMSRSSCRLRETLAMDNVTSVYLRRKGETLRSDGWFHAPAIVPTGQLRSTVLDLCRYLEMLRSAGPPQADDGARLLSPESVTAMTTGYARIDETHAYGYGLIAGELHGERVVEHGGGHKGVSARVGFLPERGITCAVLTNLAGAPSARIWNGAVNALLGLPFEPPPERKPDHALPPEHLAGLAGRYPSREGVGIGVEVDGDVVTVILGEERLPARPVGADTLAVPREGEEQELVFLRDGTGAVTHVFHGLRLIPRAERLFGG